VEMHTAGRLTGTRIRGPVTGGSHGWSFGAPVVDFDAFGYCLEEYFLEGTARRFGLRSGSELGADGRWVVEPVAAAPFKTRFLVYRPTDPEIFNGQVVLVWNNVSGGFDAFGDGDTEWLMRQGYAVVGATVQRAGVHGFAMSPMGLLAWDDGRYGSLSVVSDDYSFDIFSLVAQAVGPRRAVESVDPMAGLAVHYVIAAGGSQSAARLATYLNAIQPLVQDIDGFLLTVYFGTGSPLEVGDMVFNPSDRGTHQLVGLSGAHCLRDDLNVPVIVVNSELEAIACRTVLQPDTDRFRWWEVAGTSHSSPDVLRALSRRVERDFDFALPIPEGMCQASTQPVTKSALHHLSSWIGGGPPPPIQPRIEFAGDSPEAVRDEDGICRGGIRLPEVEVPVACNSSIPVASDFQSRLMGSCRPFAARDLRARYGDKSGYLKRFQQAADAAVAAGAILPSDGEALARRAEVVNLFDA
jgi:hypothetical protein